MKIGRFAKGNDIFYGVVEGENVFKTDGDIEPGFIIKDDCLSADDLEILSPCTPSKIVCVGLNYADHAKEQNLQVPSEPVLFLKPPSTIIGQNGRIIYPSQTSQLEYEAELAVVIKKKGKHIPRENYREYVFGYTCANDVTARDLQRKDGQWTRAKSFDTFCPLGPYIVTGIDADKLSICSYLNKNLRQSSNTRELIFPIDFLIHYISSIMTLYPGDVILTGTPSGVGRMDVGDQITVQIEGIGSLTNMVVK